MFSKVRKLDHLDHQDSNHAVEKNIKNVALEWSIGNLQLLVVYEPSEWIPVIGFLNKSECVSLGFVGSCYWNTLLLRTNDVLNTQIQFLIQQHFKETKMLTFHRTMKMYRSLFPLHNKRISLNLRIKIYGEREVSDTENGPKFHPKVCRKVLHGWQNTFLRIAVKIHCYINSWHIVHFMVLYNV